MPRDSTWTEAQLHSNLSAAADLGAAAEKIRAALGPFSPHLDPPDWDVCVASMLYELSMSGYAGQTAANYASLWHPLVGSLLAHVFSRWAQMAYAEADPFHGVAGAETVALARLILRTPLPPRSTE